MKYRLLGNTELNASVIGLGTWQFGGEWGKDFAQREVDAIIDAARQSGINLVDTAECYGDHLSEQRVGAALKSDRENWIVATKFGHRFHGFLDRDWDYSPEGVQRQLEDSLRALQTDVIDLYQFHSGSNQQFESDALWTMLHRQQQAGKVRFLGISISAGDEAAQVHQTRRASEVGASVIQLVYNRLHAKAKDELLPLCEAQHLGVLARVPLASGLLSGKYASGVQFPTDDVRSTRDREQIEDDLREVARIRREEVPDGVTTAAWALSWCLRNGIVTSVIPGGKNAEQVRENAAAADCVE